MPHSFLRRSLRRSIVDWTPDREMNSFLDSLTEIRYEAIKIVSVRIPRLVAVVTEILGGKGPTNKNAVLAFEMHMKSAKRSGQLTVWPKTRISIWRRQSVGSCHIRVNEAYAPR